MPRGVSSRKVAISAEAQALAERGRELLVLTLCSGSSRSIFMRDIDEVSAIIERYSRARAIKPTTQRVLTGMLQAGTAPDDVLNILVFVARPDLAPTTMPVYFGGVSQGSSAEVAMIPESIIEVNVVEAQGLRNADMFSLSDPYVIVHCGPHRGETEVREDTLDPKWEEVFRFPLSSDDVFFEISDRDFGKRDDHLGNVRMSVDGSRRPGVMYDEWLDVQRGTGQLHLRYAFNRVFYATVYWEAQFFATGDALTCEPERSYFSLASMTLQFPFRPEVDIRQGHADLPVHISSVVAVTRVSQTELHVELTDNSSFTLKPCPARSLSMYLQQRIRLQRLRDMLPLEESELSAEVVRSEIQQAIDGLQATPEDAALRQLLVALQAEVGN